jgi:hypothetical protein
VHSTIWKYDWTCNTQGAIHEVNSMIHNMTRLKISSSTTTLKALADATMTDYVNEQIRLLVGKTIQDR